MEDGGSLVLGAVQVVPAPRETGVACPELPVQGTAWHSGQLLLHSPLGKTASGEGLGMDVGCVRKEKTFFF